MRTSSVVAGGHSPPRATATYGHGHNHHANHNHHHNQHGISNATSYKSSAPSQTNTHTNDGGNMTRARSLETTPRRRSLPGGGFVFTAQANQPIMMAAPASTGTGTTTGALAPGSAPSFTRSISEQDTLSTSSMNSLSRGTGVSHSLHAPHLGPPPAAHIRAQRAQTRPTLSPLVGHGAASLAANNNNNGGRHRSSSAAETILYNDQSPKGHHLTVYPNLAVTSGYDNGPRTAQPLSTSSNGTMSGMPMPSSLRSIKPISPPASAPGGHPNPSLWRTSPHSQALDKLECVGHAMTAARRNQPLTRSQSPVRSVSATSRTITSTGYATNSTGTHGHGHGHNGNGNAGTHSLGVTPSGSTATLLSDGSRSHLHPHPPSMLSNINDTTVSSSLVPRLQIDAVTSSTGGSLSINTSPSLVSLGSDPGALSSTRRRAATTGDATTPNGSNGNNNLTVSASALSTSGRRSRSPNAARRTAVVMNNGTAVASIPSHGRTLAIPTDMDGNATSDAPLSARSLRSLSQSPSLVSTGSNGGTAGALTPTSGAAGVSAWPTDGNNGDKPSGSTTLGGRSASSSIAARRGGGDKEPAELVQRPWNFGVYSLQPPPPLVGERSRRASGSDVAALKRAADEAQSSYAWGSTLRSPTQGLPPRYPSGNSNGNGNGHNGGNGDRDRDRNDIAIRTTGGLNLNGDTRELSSAEAEFFAAANKRWSAQPWNYGVQRDKGFTRIKNEEVPDPVHYSERVKSQLPPEAYVIPAPPKPARRSRRRGGEDGAADWDVAARGRRGGGGNGNGNGNDRDGSSTPPPSDPNDPNGTNGSNGTRAHWSPRHPFPPQRFIFDPVCQIATTTGAPCPDPLCWHCRGVSKAAVPASSPKSLPHTTSGSGDATATTTVAGVATPPTVTPGSASNASSSSFANDSNSAPSASSSLSPSQIASLPISNAILTFEA